MCVYLCVFLSFGSRARADRVRSVRDVQKLEQVCPSWFYFVGRVGDIGKSHRGKTNAWCGVVGNRFFFKALFFLSFDSGSSSWCRLPHREIRLGNLTGHYVQQRWWFIVLRPLWLYLLYTFGSASSSVRHGVSIQEVVVVSYTRTVSQSGHSLHLVL